jgi:hypothetical protein
MTEQKRTAAEVVAEVMRDVQAVGKHDRNSAQGFNFRGIDAVVNAVGPALRKAGGFIVPSIDRVTYETTQTAKGSALTVARVIVTYCVYGQTGEPILGSVTAEAFDSGDKATAKAMSVAYRTFLLQVLCLPTDEPDPDSFTYEQAAIDWTAALGKVGTRDECLALWAKATAAKAPADILAAIEDKGKTYA